MSLIYLNGDYVPHEQAKISVFDRGFLFADGIYEVLPVYQGQPFMLAEHMQRLHNSLHAIGITPPHSPAEWEAILRHLLSIEQLDNAILYIQITRGAEFPRNHLPSPNMQPTVMAYLVPFTPPAGEPTPVKVELLEDIRWLRCDIKSVSLLGNILLKLQSSTSGGQEPILHRAGRITEGASCNYFIVKDHELITPPADELILAGLTRQHVLNLARGAHIKVREQAFSTAELFAADECFMTSATREIIPVGQVGNEIIADGHCGPVTQQLIELFRASRS